MEWTPAALHVTEKIHLAEPIFAERVRVPAGAVEEGQTPKLTIPSPNMVHYRGGRAAVDEQRVPGHGRVLE